MRWQFWYEPTEAICAVAPVGSGADALKKVFITTDRPQSGNDSAGGTPIAPRRNLAPRTQPRATPAGLDTQPHPELARETVRVRIQCLRVLQATFQLR